ncbi:hypothetical protein Tco_1526281 [Tanacetum coccineum]
MKCITNLRSLQSKMLRWKAKAGHQEESQRCSARCGKLLAEVELTKPALTFPRIKDRVPYTMMKKPLGVVYSTEVQRVKRNSLTLMKVSDDELSIMIKDYRCQYKVDWCEKRMWSKAQHTDATMMWDEIERILSCIRQMRRLESYVGGRPKLSDIRTFVRPE